MSEVVQVVAYVNLVAFVALGAVGVAQWRTRRDHAGAWVALTFGALAVVVLVGRFIPKHPHGFGQHAALRIDLAVLVLFPYLLFRFTMAFADPSRRLYRFVSVMSVALVAWTFALPHIPEQGEQRPALFNAYLAAFLVHWTVLSVASALQLWRAGRRQPTVARRRMQMLAFASGAITVAIILSASTTNSDSAVAAAAGLLATVSAIAFLLGLVPPDPLRYMWRRPEQRRLQDAIVDLMTLATSQEEVAARVLEPAAAIVGARAIAIRNAEGRIVGSYGEPPDDDAEPVVVETDGSALLVWTSPYAPFFGSEELALVRALGGLTGLALDRVRLFEQEHAARVELERANQVKTNFVALAAHELRTPVTTIHGFVQTLHHLGHRLSEGEREELRNALEEQTVRMALLVEQLLDLSRLDADAIEINPQRVNVRERVEEIVQGAAGERRNAVRLEVADELEASVDPNALDRILSNLVVNAFRYGEPPVIVTAECTDHHLRLAVEDRGTGVSPEFVPDLFERFSRSEESRAIAGGTGLGLAIARSYARAHDGDLLYESAQPHGARFRLVLPSEPAVPV